MASWTGRPGRAPATSWAPPPPDQKIGMTLETYVMEGMMGVSEALPQDLAGKPAVFLIGYKQKSQFDIDRWLIGLRQLRTPVRYFELPTIKGMLPGHVRRLY